MKIYYLVATQYTNLGDLLINKMLISELTKYGDVYLDLKNVPDDFAKSLLHIPKTIDAYREYGISLKGKEIMKTLSFIRDHNIKHFFISPGPKGTSSVFDLKAISLIFIFSIFKIIGVNQYIVGSEFVISNVFSRFYISVICRIMNVLYIRNKVDTELYKRKYGEKIRFIPDLALLYPEKLDGGINNEMWLSFRSSKLGDVSYVYNLLIPIISFCKINKLKIVLFYQVISDEKFNNELFKRISQIYNDVSFEQNIITYENIDLYCNAKYVISNRLHVLLLGYLHGAIPFYIEEDNSNKSKTGKVFESLYLTPNIIHKDELKNTESFIEKINCANKSKIFSNIDSFSQMIENEIYNIFGN